MTPDAGAAPTRPPDLLVVGNVNVDVLMGDVPLWPRAGSELLAERYELRVGGAAGNAALALRALGARFRVVAGVGDDAFGGWLERALEPAGVRLVRHPAATALSVGLVHPDGERTFVTHLGHLAAFPDGALTAALDAGRPGDLLLLCGYFLLPAFRRRAGAWLDAARERGLRVALDPGWPTDGWEGGARDELRALLPRIHAFLPNREEALGVTGADTVEGALQALDGVRTVLKLGAEGALLADGGRRHHVAAPALPVADTVGAGDTFNAGLLTALQRGWSWDRALEPAVRAASLAIASAPRRYPSWHEAAGSASPADTAAPGA